MARRPEFPWLFIVVVVSLPFLSVEIYLAANICSCLGLLLSVFVHSSSGTYGTLDTEQTDSNEEPWNNLLTLLFLLTLGKYATDLQILWTITRKTDKTLWCIPTCLWFLIVSSRLRIKILLRHQSITNADHFQYSWKLFMGFSLPLMITRVSRALVGASCSFYASFFRSVVIYNSPANTRQSLRTFRWHSVVSCAHSGTGSFCQPDFVLWTRVGLWSPRLQGSSLQVKEEAVCRHCFQL